MITQGDVNANLGHALENGYFHDLSKWTVAEIVTDLQAYAEDCEDVPDEVLTPLVQVWYDAHKSG